MVIKLTKLKYLDIGFNKFTNLPEVIGQLINLKKLCIENNKLANLEKLYIDSNRLAFLPESIGQLAKLIRLYIGDNQLAFIQLTKTEIRIKNNPIFNYYSNWKIGQIADIDLLEILAKNYKDIARKKG